MTGTLGAKPGALSFLTVMSMPKMKTYKAIRKRFRVTAKGKPKRRQAGNLGMAQSGEPVSLDLAQPTVSILTVEPGR